jgi:Domain of unknown function (DUF1707)
VATWPGDQTAAGRGRLRASHADRDLVIDTLKSAFVQGRLTKDEFDDRVGQTLAARTHAELAALTADIPAVLAQPPPPPASARDLDRLRESKVARATAGATLAAGLLMIAAIGNGSNNPVTGLVAVVLLSPVWVTLLVGLLALHFRLERHAARQRPRGPGQGGPGLDGRSITGSGHGQDLPRRLPREPGAELHAHQRVSVPHVVIR